MKYKDMTPEQRVAYNKAAYDKIKNDPKRGQKRAAWIAANRERLNTQQRARRAKQSTEKKAEVNAKSVERIKNWRANLTPEQKQAQKEKQKAYASKWRTKNKAIKDPNAVVLKLLLKAIEASQGVK